MEISEEALRAAVYLSERYITDRNLPDKAIDVLDEACSAVSLRGYRVPEHLRALEDSFKELAVQKEDSIRAGDFAEASMIQKEQDLVREKLDALKKRFHKKSASSHPCGRGGRHCGSCVCVDERCRFRSWRRVIRSA